MSEHNFSDASSNSFNSALRKNRKLLGLLCGCAWETLKQMHQGAFPQEHVRGAAVIAIQTAGDQIGWHPHLHALVPDAVWTRDGRRLPISYLDPDAMRRIFQAKTSANCGPRYPVTGASIFSLFEPGNEGKN